MKRAKAVVIASLLGGISLVFSEVSVPFVFANEEISEMAKAEESELSYENTAESESHSESSTTEQEESQSRHEDVSQTESKTESPQEEERRTQGEPETSAQETTEEKELNTDETETTLEESESDMEESTEEMTDVADESGTEESTEEMTDIVDESGQIEKRWKAGTGLTSLRMPQKFAIVMDPWEMDGRTQVYSEQYIIKNTGDMSGTLKLTGIACEAGEDVHVQENSDNIHSGKDKKVYIELLINDEDRIVLMPEGTDYEIELAPDARMTLEFTGEMNENSSENWQDSDVKISVAYDWRVEPQEIESEAAESISEEEEEGSERVSMTEEEESEAEPEPEAEGTEAESESEAESTEAESEPEKKDTETESEIEEGTEVESESEADSTESESKTEEESSETKSEIVGENTESESKTEEESSETKSEIVGENTESESETEEENSETKSEIVGENIDIVPKNESSEGVSVSVETASEAKTTTTENTAAEISAENSPMVISEGIEETENE